MNVPGAPDPAFSAAREILLDVLATLSVYPSSAIIVVGAQAVYLRTAMIIIDAAPFTIDSDIAIDPRIIPETPSLRALLEDHGYVLRDNQPGLYSAPHLEPHISEAANVDIIVPELFAADAGRRNANLQYDGSRAARRTAGLEIALYDNSPLDVGSFASPHRVLHNVHVAGRAALLVAKAHKLGDHIEDPTRPMKAKDALDVYRLLAASPAGEIAGTLRSHAGKPNVDTVIVQAVTFLRKLFATADAPGSRLLRTERHADAATTARATTDLVGDLLLDLESE